MHRKIIAIVDDDRSFGEAISIFLEDNHFHVISASTGQEGLVSLLGNDPDLAIIDVHLPDISGIDIAEQLRQAGSATPVILTSSDDCADVQARCRQAGARSFLPKPLHPEDLLKTISEILDSSR